MNYLELPSFLTDLQKKNSRSKYDLASITKMLILTRILEPSSKRRSVEKIKKYCYEFNDSLKMFIDFLSFYKIKK